MKKLIVGLGNPGKKYTNTRHNAGFMAVDYLVGELGSGEFTASSQADTLTAEVMIGGWKIGLTKPQTFMNKSGEAVQQLADYYNIEPDNILIVHDDVALPLGDVRVSHDSSAGGHNGVQSVINKLGMQAFSRIRIGIGRQVDDKQQADTRSYVLGRFSDPQKEKLEDIFVDTQKAIEVWVEDGIEPAMNKVN